MPIYEPFALIALGVFTGAYGVIIGAGGGFILGPLLILLWRLEPSAAVGTSLTVVAITAISGALGYWRTRTIDLRSGVLFALAAVPGSVLGALAVASASGSFIQISFGALLLVVSTYMALHPHAAGRQRENPDVPHEHAGHVTRTIVTSHGDTFVFTFHERAAIGVNVVFGMLSSFFGIGGGLFRVPVLVYGFGFPVGVASATSIFSMALYTGVGVISHTVLGNVDWLVLLFAGIGVVAGAQLGVRWSPKVRQAAVLRLLGLGLGVTGVWLIVKGAHLI